MKTAREKALDWAAQNTHVFEGRSVEFYMEMLDSVEFLLREQDKDTRHAIADNLMLKNVRNPTEAHEVAMNTDAV